jgi:hypothetical protein
MSEGDRYLRSVRRRRRRPTPVPEVELEPAKPRPLVSQGARSERSLHRPPPTIDQAIRNALRGSIGSGSGGWTPIL